MPCPASATTCTTLHLHDRFRCHLVFLQRLLDRSIRPWISMWASAAMCMPVSSLPDTARRHDPIAAGDAPAPREAGSVRGARLAPACPCCFNCTGIRTPRELAFLYVHRQSHPWSRRCVLLSPVVGRSRRPSCPGISFKFTQKRTRV
jgi:hypothetical protein